jgi:hypothetical protein
MEGHKEDVFAREDSPPSPKMQPFGLISMEGSNMAKNRKLVVIAFLLSLAVGCAFYFFGIHRQKMSMFYSLMFTSFVMGLLILATVKMWGNLAADKLKVPVIATWDFTKSWASNITAAGTILGYATLLSCFTSTTNFRFSTRSVYISVGMIAGGLSLLAPLAFNVSSRISKEFRKANKKASPDLFLICAGITIWGVTLQLFLGACLLRELHAANILPRLVTKFFAGLLILVSQAVVAYGALTATDVLVQDDSRKQKEDKEDRWILL